MAREAAGYSNAELCRMMGIAPTRLTSWEKGDALPNTPRLWAALCEALDITSDFILLGVTRGLNREMYARIKAAQPDSE
jgi:transcriptional regulator with XRE-family HTH domain